MRKTNIACQHLRYSEAGSSTLEFIFCAPLLVILLFVAMEINERIEHRVTSAIAAANLAWITTPTVDVSVDNSNAESLAKADILGTRAGATLGITPSTVLTDSSVVMAYTDTKRHSGAYSLHVDRARDAGSTSRGSARSTVKIGTSTADAISSGIIQAATGASRVIRQITNPSVSWIPPVFPDSEMEEQRLTWSLTSAGTGNMAIKGIEQLAESINSGMSSEMATVHQTPYQLLAHHSTYLRRDPGYHPNGYVNGPLVGLVIGSNDYNDFIEKCYFKLVVDAGECGRKNGFVPYLQKIFGLVAIGKTLIDTATIACIAASLSTGTAGCVIPKGKVIIAEGLLDEAVKMVVDSIQKKIEEKIEGTLNSLLGTVSSTIESSIKNELDKLEQKLNSAIGDALPEPDNVTN